MQLGRMIDKALAEGSIGYVREIYEALRGVCVASRDNQPIGDKMIMNAAFLVERDREPEFDEAVNTIAKKYGQRLKFKYTGPWPPYNFVNIRLKLERVERDSVKVQSCKVSKVSRFRLRKTFTLETCETLKLNPETWKPELMLLIDDLLMLPFSGFNFVMKTLRQVAEEQYTDDAPIKERLLELQLKLEAEEITEEEYAKEEADIIRQLREIQNHKRELAGAPPVEKDRGLAFTAERPGPALRSRCIRIRNASRSTGAVEDG